MRCMHSKYTNQPKSDIGKWSPESVFLHSRAHFAGFLGLKKTVQFAKTTLKLLSVA